MRDDWKTFGNKSNAACAESFNASELAIVAEKCTQTSQVETYTFISPKLAIFGEAAESRASGLSIAARGDAIPDDVTALTGDCVKRNSAAARSRNKTGARAKSRKAPNLSV